MGWALQQLDSLTWGYWAALFGIGIGTTLALAVGRRRAPVRTGVAAGLLAVAFGSGATAVWPPLVLVVPFVPLAACALVHLRAPPAPSTDAAAGST